MVNWRLSEFLKKCFRPFLKRTSTMFNGFCPEGKVMLESQSNTVSLSQLPVAQLPLLLHPLGTPDVFVAQEVQPIIVIYFECCV
jgi:hypothetical protein